MVNLIGMGLNRVFLQNSNFLKNALADIAHNFTNEKRNPTYCSYEIIFNFYEFVC